MTQSDGEAALLWQLRAAGLPQPVTEHRFAPPRRWRFDLAWTDQRLAVEVEGGSYVAGRHSRGPGFEADCEKYAEAIVQGWRVLRFTTRMVTDGRALTFLERALR